ncbi:hypothetical protein K438DRAFT_1668066 [Mycena galopus ATCC 62051]|nr:hypothetical protein K438DRAFT_1668066 [Mycena galopus ATCC 62051]
MVDSGAAVVASVTMAVVVALTTTSLMDLDLLVRVDLDLRRLDMGHRPEEGVGMGHRQADFAEISSAKDPLVGMMTGRRNGQGIEEVYLAFSLFPSDFSAKVTAYVLRSSIFGGCKYAPSIQSCVV